MLLPARLLRLPWLGLESRRADTFQHARNVRGCTAARDSPRKRIADRQRQCCRAGDIALRQRQRTRHTQRRAESECCARAIHGQILQTTRQRHAAVEITRARYRKT